MKRVLVYRARLPESAEMILSVSVQAVSEVRGPGAGRLRTLCRVTVRYAGADGRVRRHRGALQADLPYGAALRVASCQLDGAEVLVSLRQVRERAGARVGAAVSDRFTLPFGVDAWGVTALGGARVTARIVCRAREQELLLRGCVWLSLDRPGGTLRFRIPFLRSVVVPDLPAGLRWRAIGGVTGLHARVEPGGRVVGELVLALRCEGRPRPTATGHATEQAPLAVIHEVTGSIRGLAAEAAGAGHAVVRGTVEVDLYGSDAQGAGRWAGRSLQFSALLEVADGDRLEAFARIERLSHGPAGVQAALSVEVTALRLETLLIDGLPYRAERIAGTARTTVIVAEEPACPPAAPALDWREGMLPLPGPPQGWAEVAVALSTPQWEAKRGAGRWSVRAVLGGTPAGEVPYPAPLRAGTGGTISAGDGAVLAVAPALTSVDAAGIRLRTALATGPALQSVPALPEGESVRVHLPLPGPARAVIGLQVSEAGPIHAIVKGDGFRIVRGQAANGGRRLAAVTAYPVIHNGQWQLRVRISQAKTGPQTI